MQKVIALLLGAAVALLAVSVYQRARTTTSPKFTTPYQAVVLTTGQVYYGRLEHAGDAYPVLRDVFYVSTQVNTVTKETSSVIVRRGKELHGPEYMVLNHQSILFIEPVKEDSQIARFIAEQQKKSE